jgi:hypothetical protein
VFVANWTVQMRPVRVEGMSERKGHPSEGVLSGNLCFSCSFGHNVSNVSWVKCVYGSLKEKE